MAQFNERHPSSVMLKSCAMNRVWRPNWPVEGIIAHVIRKDRVDRTWSATELLDEIYGGDSGSRHKVVQALDQLEGLGVIERTSKSFLSEETYWVTKPFIDFTRERLPEDNNILQVSLKVAGKEVPAQRLREFKEHTAHVLKNFPDIQIFTICEGVQVNREEAEALLKQLDESYLF